MPNPSGGSASIVKELERRRREPRLRPPTSVSLAPPPEAVANMMHNPEDLPAHVGTYGTCTSAVRRLKEDGRGDGEKLRFRVPAGGE
ncbi:hypothetical protein DPEC_G00293690 [Dallia pectoralis]|uniref:Uncharacterized protein n=1 Tax=Dallia pectoralis TaxID=75939 RepID=A0ACC2FI89_DALPE|nr:hypothetical protein DPEC_G00293690 [Dallia pectoralis]